MGLEGIVAEAHRPALSVGRGETWIKVKAKRAMTLPIIGYVPAAGCSIAALRLGRREGQYADRQRRAEQSAEHVRILSQAVRN